MGVGGDIITPELRVIAWWRAFKDHLGVLWKDSEVHFPTLTQRSLGPPLSLGERMEKDWRKTGKRLGEDWGRLGKTGERLEKDWGKIRERLGKDWEMTGKD